MYYYFYLIHGYTRITLHPYTQIKEITIWVKYMERKILLLTIALITILAVVNATVYAYRWIQGTVTIAPPDQATGAACTGFYSSVDQRGIDLPPAGTNFNAPTYGTNQIIITPGRIVCTWNGYELYESIEVIIPVTVGSWYIQDFYGFGYYNGTDPVYVYFRVDEAISNPIISRAILRIRSGEIVLAELNLLEAGAISPQLTLNPGGGWQLDLFIDASGAGSVTFKVGVYVTQEAGEMPVGAP